MRPPAGDLDDLAGTHGPFVRALALRLAPGPAVSEDIAQQVLLEFVRKSAQWDLTRDVRPLLASMTRNVALRCWRERAKRSSPEMRELAEHIKRLASAREGPLYSEEEKDALRECLEKLPNRSRKILDAHYALGMTSSVVGKTVGSTAAAVRRALFRLRARLRKCIEEQMSGGARVQPTVH